MNKIQSAQVRVHASTRAAVFCISIGMILVAQTKMIHDGKLDSLVDDRLYKGQQESANGKGRFFSLKDIFHS